MSVLSNIALITSAQTGVPNVSAGQVLNSGLNIVYFVVGLVAVVMIILAGFRLVTGGSNPKQLEQAKNMILYSVIGLVVIISAFTVTWFILGRFQ